MGRLIKLYQQVKDIFQWINKINNCFISSFFIEMAEEVSEMFINKTNITHEGGHYIPSKKEYYKEFIMEMFLNKNKNNQ